MKNKVLITSITFAVGIYIVLHLVDVCRDFYYIFGGEDGWSWASDGAYAIESAIVVALTAVTLVLLNIAEKKNSKVALPAIFLMAALTIYNMSGVLLNCLILAVVWYNHRKCEEEISYEKALTVTVALAYITAASVVIIPLASTLIMVLINSMDVGMYWTAFVFGSMIVGFVFRPELIMMIYLRRQCKNDLHMEETVRNKVKKTTTIYFALWIVVFVAMVLIDLSQIAGFDTWSSDFLEAGDWSEWETE